MATANATTQRPTPTFYTVTVPGMACMWGPLYTLELAEITHAGVRQRWPEAVLNECTARREDLIEYHHKCAERERPLELEEVARIR